MANYSKSDVQFKVSIPKGYTLQQRQEIAQLIINKIIERCDNGLDKNNRSFKYAPDSKFDGNNLTYTGAMLTDGLQLIATTQNSITIGYEPDTFEADKAAGNNLGTYGKDTPSAYAKPFLGISDDDLELILAQIDPDTIVDDTKVSSFIKNFLG
jgi:hypothetical protein